MYLDRELIVFVGFLDMVFFVEKFVIFRGRVNIIFYVLNIWLILFREGILIFVSYDFCIVLIRVLGVVRVDR